MIANPFDSPTHYRQQLLNLKPLSFSKKNFSGKSVACLFLTRFCSVGCSFCFFRSAPAWRKPNIEDQFSDEGLEKFLSFARKANLGYLLVSGGGEPLTQKKHVLKLIESTPTDRIVLATSANWAKNYDTAFAYLEKMYEALQKRTTPCHLVVRVSISDYHTIKLGLQGAVNLVQVFWKHFKDTKNFSLQIKAFEGDGAFKQLLGLLPDARLDPVLETLVSDNHLLQKKIPTKRMIHFPNGFQIVVSMSKIFESFIKPDLYKYGTFSRAVKVFEEDIALAEDGNPSVVYNNDGSLGLDWSISYNGNICIWQNQVRDTYRNLYAHSYEEIFHAYMEDPISYSVLDRSPTYRDQIISEVSQRTVQRAKAMGLRDALGAILFEEERLRLYYSIRVLQDYIHEGRIPQESLARWPTTLTSLVSTPVDLLKKWYKKSKYNIVAQEKHRRVFNKEAWYDFLELIKLGHYDLTQQEEQEALDYYNTRAWEKIASLTDVVEQSGDVVRRLTERLMYIVPTADP